VGLDTHFLGYFEPVHALPAERLALEGDLAWYDLVEDGDVVCKAEFQPVAKVVGLLDLAALTYNRGLSRRDVIRLIAAYSFGVAIPILGVLSLYALYGAVPDLLYANLTYNFRYVGLGASLLALVPASLRGSGVRLVACALLLVALIILTRTLLRQIRRRPAATNRHSRCGLSTKPATATEQDMVLGGASLLWLVGAYAGAKLGGRDFPHYFAPVLPPALLLLCVNLTFDRGPHRRYAFLSLGSVLVVAALFLRSSFAAFGQNPNALAVQLYGTQAKVWAEYEPVGAWLRTHASSSDTLFVVGAEPGFYWQSGLQPATRLLYDYPIWVDPELHRYLLATLNANPPTFVVETWGVSPDYMSALEEYSYRQIASFETVRVLALDDRSLGNRPRREDSE